MRDIYLIDFENVASEGLSGITYLGEDDQVIIFYSNNSNRLTMKMHILIGKSVCDLQYFEVTVGGKNALDHQISTWLGYLVGTGAAERNYYIVSRDMGYKHVANFWGANGDRPRVRCVDTIKAAGRLERNRREQKEAVPQAEPVREETAQPQETVSEPMPVAEPVPPVVEVVVAEESAARPEPVADLPEEAAPVEVPVEAPVVETEVPPELPVQETISAEELLSEILRVESGTDAENPAEEARPESEESSHRKNYRRGTRTRSRRTKAEQPVKTEAAPEKQPQEAAPEKAEPQQGEKKPQKKVQKKEEKSSSDALSVLIAPYPKLQENVLRDLIANNKKQILCNTLRKHLGQEKGLALYNEIKRTAWN